MVSKLIVRQITMKIFKDKRPFMGQDPFIAQYDDTFLIIQAKNEEKIILYSIESLDNLHAKKETVVWDDPNEREVWAPELHYTNNKWYIYYASSNGNNSTHRMFVLESDSPHGPYHKVGGPLHDVWGIDLTIFVHQDKRYAVWSGWENDRDEFPQNLYIAEMPTPTSLGTRILLAFPTLPWETSIAPINEGPQAWYHDDRLFLFYAANASWTCEYSIGLLELIGQDPLNPTHWFKYPFPLMQNAGHGHPIDNTFIYHRKLSYLPSWHDREIVTIPLDRLLRSNSIVV